MNSFTFLIGSPLMALPITESTFEYILFAGYFHFRIFTPVSALSPRSLKSPSMTSRYGIDALVGLVGQI